MKNKEFKLKDLFDVKTTKKKFNAKDVLISGIGHPYVVRSSEKNGIRGYIQEDENYLNEGNTISFGQDTATIFYQKKPYFTGDKIKILYPKYEEFNEKNAQYIITVLNKAFIQFGWGSTSFSEDILKNVTFELPVLEVDNKSIDWNYMEQYVNGIEKKYLQQIEEYFETLGYSTLEDTLLTRENKLLLERTKVYKAFKLEELFDVIKRGKRIKSLDRIPGKLPFITAGVEKMGFSSFIGNPEVEIFPEDSLTIDMFGTTFYRGYKYGADDHIAVLYRTDNKFSKKVLQYIQVNVNKVLEGKFSYSRNFYASDAPEVEIKLPVTLDGDLDIDLIEEYMHIFEKKVVKRVMTRNGK